mmetsp:Transcript_56052/g.81983  ORF Transcript_56052/g.81983 Transcript_56052/m.81983 type:complete len:225 (+) Transcript_56052:108-782(+)
MHKQLLATPTTVQECFSHAKPVLSCYSNVHSSSNTHVQRITLFANAFSWQLSSYQQQQEGHRYFIDGRKKSSSWPASSSSTSRRALLQLTAQLQPDAFPAACCSDASAADGGGAAGARVGLYISAPSPTSGATAAGFPAITAATSSRQSASRARRPSTMVPTARNRHRPPAADPSPFSVRLSAASRSPREVIVASRGYRHSSLPLVPTRRAYELKTSVKLRPSL